MELFFLVFSATLSEEIEIFLKTNNIGSFTLFPLVHGSGQGGGTKMDTEVWPGYNQMYMLCLDKKESDIIKSWVKQYKNSPTREGIKLMSVKLETII